MIGLRTVNAKDIKWNKEGSTKLPRYVARIAQLIDSDPDPYFSGVSSVKHEFFIFSTLQNLISELQLVLHRRIVGKCSIKWEKYFDFSLCRRVR